MMMAASVSSAARAEAFPARRARPVPLTQVRLADPFWAPRQQIVRRRSLPAAIRWCEKTGRIANFVRVAAGKKGGFRGTWFNDSDVYKVIEGASYLLALHRDEALRKTVGDLVAKVAGAQQADGYLYCYHILGDPAKRWKQIHRPARHELYCAGHMIEAGVAHYESTGSRKLLGVAVRLADHIASVFGPGKRPDVPEHQGIELALIRLYRVTADARHLALARHFLESRGVARGRTLYGAYSQDHLPPRKQAEAVGHAVRATYFYAGLADLAMATGDPELLSACRRLWESITLRKMYLTGGVGASRGGEAFGADYDLPNDTAYAETCAAIGLVLFAHRMLQLDPDGRYADGMERALYNAVACGLSLDGTRYFYNCPLGSRGLGGFFRAGGAQGGLSHHRSEWFGCACCPSNVIRLLPQVGGFLYTHGNRGIHVNLYAAGTAKLKLPATDVTLRQETDYPWEGKVRITVAAREPAEFDVLLRIPGWCRAATVKVNGTRVGRPAVHKGYARLRRRWGRGDVIDLDLPMPVERRTSPPGVRANAGRVALQRGPLVYCLEGVDHGGRVRHLALLPGSALKAEHREDLLGGVTVITTRSAAKPQALPIVAVPFCLWDNRGPGPMIVWIPEDPALAEPVPQPTIASRARVSASHCFASDTVAALNDQVEPPNSHSLKIPRMTWWNHLGTKEWVQYDFARPQEVSRVEVYWFDDRRTGRCHVPASWQLLWRDADRWRPVEAASAYPTQRDRYNRVTFKPVRTTALRIAVQLRKKCSGGILEWRVLK